MKPTREHSEREMSAQEQDDITMTQEELADDVRWEESPGAPEERPRSRQATAAPVLAKRSHSTLIKNISKKPKRSGRTAPNKTNSIEDIMGILDKRGSSEHDGVQALDKENSLQFNSQPGAAAADAVEGNEDAEIFSATAMLSGNTVGTVEHDLDVGAVPAAVPAPPLIAAVAASLQYDAAVATLAGLEDMTQMLRAGTTQSLPPPAGVPTHHAGQDPYFAATQTWENNGFGYESGSSTKGFGYASTGTARPTPADPPTMVRSRSELGATGGGYGVTAVPSTVNQAQITAASSSTVNLQKQYSSAVTMAKTHAVNGGYGKTAVSVAAASSVVVSAAGGASMPHMNPPRVQVPIAPHVQQQQQQQQQRNQAYAQQPPRAAPLYSQEKSSLPIRPAGAANTVGAGGPGLPQRPQGQSQVQNSSVTASSHNNSLPRPTHQHAQPTQTTGRSMVHQGTQQQQLPRQNNQQWAHPPSMPETPLFAPTSAHHPTKAVIQQPPAAAPSAHVFEPMELSEEALAQLLELERAAMEPASAGACTTCAQPVNPAPPASILPQPNQAAAEIELSDADLARLLELEQSAIAQEHPAASTTALSQQCQDITLTDDVLAQLLELEMAAMAQMNTTEWVDIAGAKPSTAEQAAPSSSSGATGPSSEAVVPSTLLCMRLVALDVADNHITRTKEIQAFQPGGDDSLRENSGSGSGSDARGGASRRNGRIDTVEDTFSELITVELTGDWYNCPIVSGDIFHVVDLGPEESHSSHTAGVRPNPASIFSALGSTKRVTVTDSWGLVVTQPDILVSPTKVAESCNCIRRGVLTDRVRSFGDLSAPAVLGNLKHAFIEALTEKLLDILQSLPQQHNINIQQVRSALSRDTICGLMATAKAALVQDLYLVGCTDESVTAELAAFVEPTVAWVFTMYTQGVQALQQGVAGGGHSAQGNASASSSTSGNGSYSQRNNPHSGSHTVQESQCLPAESSAENVNFRMTSVTNAEETVWSAVLGMKGQMDLLTKAKIGLLSSFPASVVRELMEYTLPVELKTGKWRPSTVIGHRAQVILYVVMMAIRERGGVSLSTQKPAMIPKHGLIVYLSPEETKVDLIKPSWAEVRALMMSRNKLANYIRDVSLGVNSTGASKSPLPPLLHSPFDCQYCYQAAECMIYHAMDGGTAVSSGVKELFSYVLRGITPAQLSYFKHWDELLNLEALATAAPAHSWTSAADRRRDKCIAGLTFQSCQPVGDAANARYLIIFTRDVAAISGDADLSLAAGEEVLPAEASMAVNDRVQISVEASAEVVGRALRRRNNNGTRTTNGTTVSNSGGASSSASHPTDMEDMGGMFRSNSKAVMFTDANVTSGFVELVSATEVHVVVSEDPKRFKQLYSGSAASNWKFRVDKDEITINITTMRSNLLALFVQPFRPKDFQQAKTLDARKLKEGASASAAGGPESNENEAPANTRWRQLIVDLASPRFRSPGNLQDELLLMRPLGMAVGVYQQALKMLFQHLQQGGQSLEMSRQQLSHMGVTAAAVPAGTGAVTCVSKGPVGELHVFGGLTVYPGCNPFSLAEEFKTLNTGQAAAVRKILLAQDYALLLGLPGTGKTSTLSLVIRMMICRGQKVLLTSFTHSAVDHLLMKLAEAGMLPAQVMRIGTKNSIHSDVQRFALDGRSDLAGSVSALQHYLKHVRLVACTVLAASRNQLVKSLSLDCCVMDEAGQIAQPAALGAVLAARTCVLVGDDYQLPPLVVSIEAQAKGMNVSLFKRFMEAHPAAVCSLTIQYRMNQDIMSVCNALIYEYRMQCAVSSIAQARIRLLQAQLIPLPVNTVSLRTSAPASSPRSDWLHLSLQANPAVVFLNTDNLACNLAALINPPASSNQQRGAGGNNSISSEPEAHIVRILITALLAAKFDLKDVGVICPFRAQVGLIATKIKASLGEAALQDCEVSTVDKYQGRDKDVIILSTVKSCVDGGDSVGNLLRDWRRINVAITRAKHKLIVIGSFAIMQQVPVLQGFTKLTQNNNWTIDLPPDALEMYTRP